MELVFILIGLLILIYVFNKFMYSQMIRTAICEVALNGGMTKIYETLIANIKLKGNLEISFHGSQKLVLSNSRDSLLAGNWKEEYIIEYFPTFTGVSYKCEELKLKKKWSFNLTEDQDMIWKKIQYDINVEVGNKILNNTLEL